MLKKMIAMGLCVGVVACGADNRSPEQQRADAIADGTRDKADYASDKVGDAKDATKDAADDAADNVKDKAGKAKDKAGEAKDKAADKAGDAKDDASDKAGDARDAARDYADAAGDKAADARDAVKDKAGDVRDATHDYANKAGDKATDAKDAVKDKFNDVSDAVRGRMANGKGHIEDAMGEARGKAMCAPYRGSMAEGMINGARRVNMPVTQHDGLMLLSCGVCDAYAEDNDMGGDYEYKHFGDCVDDHMTRLGKHYDAETCSGEGKGFVPTTLSECVDLAKDKENSYSPIKWAKFQMHCQAYQICQ